MPDGDGVIAGAPSPRCCRTSCVTKAEASMPHAEQTKCIGCAAISGVTSKVYFAPQEHCSFMVDQGFSSTTPCVSTSEKAEFGGLASACPSQKRMLPPYCL
jgi:hypothetical protein